MSQLLHVHALTHIERKLFLLGPSTIQCSKKLLMVVLSMHLLFNVSTSEMQLVCKMRRDFLYHFLERDPFLVWWAVGNADSEEILYELWVPEGNAVGEICAPFGKSV